MENQVPLSPQDSLALIAETRAAAAERFVTPWWYHPALGLLVGGHLVVWTMAGTLFRAVATVIFLAGIVVLVQTYKRLAGVWVEGTNAGRASRWAYLLGGLYGVSMIGSWAVHAGTDLVWPVIVLGVVVLVGTVLIGSRFDEAFRAQLREGA